MRRSYLQRTLLELLNPCESSNISSFLIIRPETGLIPIIIQNTVQKRPIYSQNMTKIQWYEILGVSINKRLILGMPDFYDLMFEVSNEERVRILDARASQPLVEYMISEGSQVLTQMRTDGAKIYSIIYGKKVPRLSPIASYP